MFLFRSLIVLGFTFRTSIRFGLFLCVCCKVRVPLHSLACDIRFPITIGRRGSPLPLCILGFLGSCFCFSCFIDEEIKIKACAQGHLKSGKTSPQGNHPKPELELSKLWRGKGRESLQTSGVPLAESSISLSRKEMRRQGWWLVRFLLLLKFSSSWPFHLCLVWPCSGTWVWRGDGATLIFRSLSLEHVLQPLAACAMLPCTSCLWGSRPACCFPLLLFQAAGNYLMGNSESASPPGSYDGLWNCHPAKNANACFLI